MAQGTHAADRGSATGGEKQGLFPEPWKSGLIARLTIDRVVGLAQIAPSSTSEQDVEPARRLIAQFVDDWCATPPRPKWPLPWPFPFALKGDIAVHPADLIVMGIQFSRGADALGESALARDLTAAADKLVETGLGRLT